MIDTRKLLKKIIEIGERFEYGLVEDDDKIDVKEIIKLKREAEKCLKLCAGCVGKDRHKLLKIRKCIKDKAGSIRALAKMIDVNVNDVRYLTVHGRCRSLKLKEWVKNNCGIEIELNGKRRYKGGLTING
jgi:hypothetical protein